MKKHYVGLDISMKTTFICIIDIDGNIVEEGSTKTSPIAIAKFLIKTKYKFASIGLETGSMSNFLCKELLEFDLPIVCVDAFHLHRFLSIKINKTDKNDARDIAEAMRCGAYKKVHLKSNNSVEMNCFLNGRETLVEARTKISNSLRGLLKPFGITSLGSASSKEFLQRCNGAIEKLPELVKDVCLRLIDSLVNLFNHIELLDKKAKEIASNDNIATLLMTAPGIGPITALRFKSEIDQVGRFTDPRSVGAYFGLTPTQYSSGEIQRQGKISHKGSRRMRNLLVESAIVILTRSQKWSKLKAWGFRLMKNHCLMESAVAVARKLSVILYQMMSSETEFVYGNPKKKEYKVA